MKSKIIAGSILAAVILVGALTGTIVHQIQRHNLISETQALFDGGKYQEIVDKFGPKIQGDSIAADERIWAAKSLYRLRQYDRVQEVLDPLLRTGQEDARAMALSGWVWVKKNSPLQAQVRFEKAANMGLEGEAEGGMGAVSLLRSENYRSSFLNEAEVHLKKSISIDPNIPEVYLTFSELRRLQHNYDEAAAMAQKAVEIAPVWSEPYGTLGWIHLLQGNYTEAEKALNESQKYGGSKEQTQYYLALSVYYQGRLTEALSLLETLAKSGEEKVRDALIDAAKIALVIDEEKSIDLLKRAWALKTDPIVGMQLFELLSRRQKNEEARKILTTVIADWPFLSLAHLEMGNIWLKENEINRAYSSYQNVLERDGKNYLANYNLGYILPLRGNIQLAPDYFETVVRECDDYFPAQVNLILSQLNAERTLEAENQVLDLLNRFPNNPYILLARALERFAAGDFAASLDFLDRSQQAGQQQAAPSIIRGDIFLRLFQFDKALSNFDEALKIDETNLRALLGKAHASYRLGEYAKAEQIYQQLFTHLTSFSADQQAEIKNGLAMVALDQGETAKSIEIWNEMKNGSGATARQFSITNSGLLNEANPAPLSVDDLKVSTMSKDALPETYYNLSVFQTTLHNIPDAIKTYETLIKRFPNYLPGLYNLANLYRNEGRVGDAIALYDRAHRSSPHRVDILNNQAAVYMKMEQFAKAKERLDDAEEIDSNFIEIHYNKILVALREGKKDEAKQLLKNLKSTGLSSMLVTFSEGLVKMSENDWSTAEKAFSNALNLDPENTYACVNHGITLAKLKRYDEAQTELQKAVRLDPQFGEAHRMLGLLYCELGLFQLAEPELQAALELDPSQSDLSVIINQIQGWIEKINP